MICTSASEHKADEQTAVKVFVPVAQTAAEPPIEPTTTTPEAHENNTVATEEIPFRPSLEESSRTAFITEATRKPIVKADT